MTAPTRRGRIRTATVTEIKACARQLLVTGGPRAISLRGIARDMGMTAPAIYRYFDGIEALIGALAGDLYDELRECVEAARDAAGDEPLGQLGAMARAFRRWSVTHPVEFALIFGTPVPGMATFETDCAGAEHPAARFGAVFMRPFVELWRRNPPETPRGVPTETPDGLRPGTSGAGPVDGRLGDALDPLRQTLGDLPPEAAYVLLSGWTRLYGLVSLDVFHHLGWAVTDPEALFEAGLAACLREISGATGTPVRVPLPTARDPH